MQTHPNLELHGGILSPLSNLDLALGRLDSLQQLSLRWDEVDDSVIKGRDGTTEERVSTSGVSTGNIPIA